MSVVVLSVHGPKCKLEEKLIGANLWSWKSHAYHTLYTSPNSTCMVSKQSYDARFLADSFFQPLAYAIHNPYFEKIINSKSLKMKNAHPPNFMYMYCIAEKFRGWKPLRISRYGLQTQKFYFLSCSIAKVFIHESFQLYGTPTWIFWSNSKMQILKTEFMQLLHWTINYCLT